MFRHILWKAGFSQADRVTSNEMKELMNIEKGSNRSQLIGLMPMMWTNDMRVDIHSGRIQIRTESES